MKVYVVRQEWRYNCEEENELDIFETKDKAKKFLAEELKRLKEDYNIAEKDEFDDYCESEEDAYYYCYSRDDRFDIWIEEKEVL